VYPETLKTVSVDLKPFPVNGVARPTRSSLKAISNLWTKIFTGFRPGLSYYVHNIHLWDDIDFPCPPRLFVLNIFCRLWKGAEAKGLDSISVWEECWPHVKFVRGPGLMPGSMMVHCNHDGTPKLNPDGTLATLVVGS
jgi:hypothetical protein